MDRFIAKTGNCAVDVNMSLKSNMDRFIDGKIQQSGCYVYCLKSNMDRFIVG